MPKNKTTKNSPKNNLFQLWLLPGLIAITLYLVTVLITALFMKQEGGITPEASLVVSILNAFTVATILWWLIASAYWIISIIDRRGVKKPKARKR